MYYRKQELKAMVQQWLQQLHARNRMCENLRDLTVSGDNYDAFVLLRWMCWQMFVMDACSPLVQILHPRMRAYHGASLISMAKEDRATIDCKSISARASSLSVCFIAVAGRMAAYGLTFRTVDSVTPPMKWPHKNQEESATKEMVWEPDLTQLMKSFTTDGALMRKVKQSTRSTISSSSQRRLDGVFQELRPCPRWLSTEVQTMIQTEIKKNVVREKVGKALVPGSDAQCVSQIYGVEKGDASIPVVASTKASTPSKMLPMPANTPPVPAAPSRAHLGKVDAFFKKTTPAEVLVSPLILLVSSDSYP